MPVSDKKLEAEERRLLRHISNSMQRQAPYSPTQSRRFVRPRGSTAQPPGESTAGTQKQANKQGAQRPPESPKAATRPAAAVYKTAEPVCVQVKISDDLLNDLEAIDRAFAEPTTTEQAKAAEAPVFKQLLADLEMYTRSSFRTRY